jgi:hypothetical protein
LPAGFPGKQVSFCPLFGSSPAHSSWNRGRRLTPDDAFGFASRQPVRWESIAVFFSCPVVVFRASDFFLSFSRCVEIFAVYLAPIRKFLATS